LMIDGTVRQHGLCLTSPKIGRAGTTTIRGSVRWNIERLHSLPLMLRRDEHDSRGSEEIVPLCGNWRSISERWYRGPLISDFTVDCIDIAHVLIHFTHYRFSS
jgi:hypothetical protein